MKMSYSALLGYVVASAASAAVVGSLLAQPAPPQPQPPDVSGVQCPAPTPGSPSATCKVITLTPLEEQALVGERGILDTAQQGRPLDLTGAVTYFREKIKQASEGKPAQPQLSSPVMPTTPEGAPAVVPVPPKPEVGAIPRRAPNAPPEHSTTVVPPK